MLSNNRRSILPITFPTPIITYFHHSNIFTMAMNHGDFKNLLYSYYIQMCFDKERMNRIEVFPHIHMWHHGIVFNYFDINHKKLTLDNQNIIGDIFGWIDEGHFVTCFLSDHLIRGAFDHHKTIKMVHPYLIFGYDKGKEVFYSLGFNKKRQYGKLEIDFSDFERSVHSEETKRLLAEPPYHRESHDFIELYKIKDDFHYSFKVDVMKNQIKHFLNSTNTSIEYALLFPVEENSYWGISVADGIVDYLQSLTDTFDIRIFHCVHENILLWKDRCEFLAENGLIDLDKHLEGFRGIEQKSGLLRMQALKYESYFNRNIKTNSDPQIDEMIQSIKIIFNDLERSVAKILGCL